LRQVGLPLFFLFLPYFIFVYAAEKPLYEGRFDTKSTGVFLPIKIEGKACKFLFDTGASFVVLDKKFRPLLGKALSLKETQARTGIAYNSKKILTPNGEILLELFKSVPLKLGRLQVANRFPYILADLQSLWPFSGVKFCGVLGTSFLHQFRWEINFDKGEIKAYVGEEPYMGEYSSRKRIYWSKAHIPYVGVDLQGHEIAFDIDLGDNGSGRMLKENILFLKERGEVIKTQIQDVVTVSSLSQSEEFRLDSFRFANVNYPGLVMQESQQNALGLAFFKRHNMILDFPFNMLYLQHHKNYAQREELNKSGMRLLLKEKKVIVFNVDPRGAASVEGIQKDDEVVTVNGKRDLSLYEVRQLLRGKTGERLSFGMKRHEDVFQANITLGKDPLE